MRPLIACALLVLSLASPAGARPASVPRYAAPIDSATRIDNDARAAKKPAEWETNFYGHQFREAVIEPISHMFDVPDKLLWVANRLGARTDREAVNENAYDEVGNSLWFTNRNHVRSVSTDAIVRGPQPDVRPQPPYTIKKAKSGGASAGFQIKDAAGKRWLVKLDPAGCPQLSSGADVIVDRLFWAAGYNVPHDVAFTFRREELEIDRDLLAGKEGAPFTEADLGAVLRRGHRGSDGRYYALGSLFLSGQPVGAVDFRRRRQDDPNDWYTHPNRRELRGLYVFASWVGGWDMKDHNSLDMFSETRDSLGSVTHYLLDLGGSLGAQAHGPKWPEAGYEMTFDWKWISRRLVTLGFVVEPWRRAKQESGIPSVGRFESAVYEPQRFRPQQPHAGFRRMTDRDGYWAAKIVASFSEAQIAAAIDAVGFEDPRAKPYLLRALVERRDKIARHWFGRVAPLDFFHVSGGELAFHDLAVDIGAVVPRGYVVLVRPLDGRALEQRLRLRHPSLQLTDLGEGTRRVRLVLSVEGSDAKPATVEMVRRGHDWRIARVRHA